MLSNIGENQTGDFSSLIMPLGESAQNTDLLYIFRLQTISHGEEEETHSGKAKRIEIDICEQPIN